MNVHTLHFRFPCSMISFSSLVLVALHRVGSVCVVFRRRIKPEIKLLKSLTNHIWRYNHKTFQQKIYLRWSQYIPRPEVDIHTGSLLFLISEIRLYYIQRIFLIISNMNLPEHVQDINLHLSSKSPLSGSQVHFS